MASSAEAITTSGLGLPAAAVAYRSIAAASAYGSVPEIAAPLRPVAAGTSPTRITCAPPTEAAPVGARRCSAFVVAGGSAPGPESRIGARIGGAMRTDAAIAACQSSVGASATAVGWVPGTVEGNTASATPAALAIELLPETRVVFLVASTGKPTPAVTDTGELAAAVVVLTISSVALPPQPATSPQAATIAIGRVGRVGHLHRIGLGQ